MSTSAAIQVGAVDDEVSVAKIMKQIDRITSEQPTTVSADALADVLATAQNFGSDERFEIAGHLAEHFQAQGLPPSIQSVVSRFVFPAAWAAAEYARAPSRMNTTEALDTVLSRSHHPSFRVRQQIAAALERAYAGAHGGREMPDSLRTHTQRFVTP